MTKKYEEEYKIMIAELYATGQSVEHLSSEYGICTQTIYRWIKHYGKKTELDISESEVKALKKDLAQMKEEITILKKALTIFAQK